MSWNLVYNPKEVGGLGLGKISLRNQALLRKWLRRYPKESTTLWHKVILSIYGTHPNGWNPNYRVRWSHRCPWKAIAQLLQVFSTNTCFVAGDGFKIRFWEDLWWGDQPFCVQFPSLSESPLLITILFQLSLIITLCCFGILPFIII